MEAGVSWRRQRSVKFELCRMARRAFALNVSFGCVVTRNAVGGKRPTRVAGVTRRAAQAEVEGVGGMVEGLCDLANAQVVVADFAVARRGGKMVT